MKKSAGRQAYHHGDLRSALLATGLKLLEEKDEGGIGLREVARETGVSATAVYRHFPDKDALFTALAKEGFDRLADAQEAAASRHEDRQRAFHAIGCAYVRFALDNPALFRLMTSYMPMTEPGSEHSFTNRAGTLLRTYVAALLPPDAGQQRRMVVAVQAWAIVHGLAVLILSGQIPDDDRLIEAVVDEFGGWERG